MIFEEKTVTSQRVYEGKILNLRRDRVTTVNGFSEREIVEHCGASVIAAVTEDDRLILVRQYRKPAERVVLEVPAGKIDPGETPLEAAVRELREETGYTADHMEFLTRMLPCVGYSEEVLHVYLATGLTPGETDFDENEAIDIVSCPIETLFDQVMAGEIEDGKTQMTILMVRERLAAGRLRGGWRAPAPESTAESPADNAADRL